jgi:hypothetical protein
LNTSLTTRRAQRWKIVAVIFAVLLVLCALGAAGLRVVRREHHALVLLTHAVERAAAPDEPVLVEGGVLAELLRPSAPVELRAQMVVARDGTVPTSLLARQNEMVLVAVETSPLLGELRRSGFSMIEDPVWSESGLMNDLPVSGAVRIYFAVPGKRP